MRKAWILSMVLLASIALACGKGSVVVDIIGSHAENTKIIFPGSSLDLEMIGSYTNNTQVLSKAPVNCTVFNWCSCESRKKPECQHEPAKFHLGVDAWYGRYWYTHNYMPKWPQF